VVQAITSITEATQASYASSLVGKEVTLGQYDNQGGLQETVGTVTGMGLSNGSQIIFVDGEAHSLTEILAVGRLPSSTSSDRVYAVEQEEEDEEEEQTETIVETQSTEQTEDTLADSSYWLEVEDAVG
jgi:flagellar basal-body rod modification protein FlgD